jgi:hypothetical protein
VRRVGDLAEDLMANSTASVFIKPTAAFNRGDTFVFGSWVCTADGTRSFQRCLTMPPNPEIGLVTLPEVVTGNLTGKFGEISLYNQHADFELESASNSNSTSSWAIVCESVTYPSHADFPLRERFTCGPRNVSRAHAKAPTARRAGKEIVPECDSDSNTVLGYNSDSNPLSGFYSDSSYEFDFGSVLTDKTRIHLRSASVRTYTFFTTRFPRFLSIRGARGLLALNQVLI